MTNPPIIIVNQDRSNGIKGFDYKIARRVITSCLEYRVLERYKLVHYTYRRMQIQAYFIRSLLNQQISRSPKIRFKTNPQSQLPTPESNNPPPISSRASSVPATDSKRTPWHQLHSISKQPITCLYSTTPYPTKFHKTLLHISNKTFHKQNCHSDSNNEYGFADNKRYDIIKQYDYNYA